MKNCKKKSAKSSQITSSKNKKKDNSAATSKQKDLHHMPRNTRSHKAPQNSKVKPQQTVIQASQISSKSKDIKKASKTKIIMSKNKQVSMTANTSPIKQFKGKIGSYELRGRSKEKEKSKNLPTLMSPVKKRNDPKLNSRTNSPTRMQSKDVGKTNQSECKDVAQKMAIPRQNQDTERKIIQSRVQADRYSRTLRIQSERISNSRDSQSASPVKNLRSRQNGQAKYISKEQSSSQILLIRPEFLRNTRSLSPVLKLKNKLEGINQIKFQSPIKTVVQSLQKVNLRSRKVENSTEIKAQTDSQQNLTQDKKNFKINPKPADKSQAPIKKEIIAKVPQQEEFKKPLTRNQMQERIVSPKFKKPIDKDVVMKETDQDQKRQLRSGLQLQQAQLSNNQQQLDNKKLNQGLQASQTNIQQVVQDQKIMNKSLQSKDIKKTKNPKQLQSKRREELKVEKSYDQSEVGSSKNLQETRHYLRIRKQQDLSVIQKINNVIKSKGKALKTSKSKITSQLSAKQQKITKNSSSSKSKKKLKHQKAEPQVTDWYETPLQQRLIEQKIKPRLLVCDTNFEDTIMTEVLIEDQENLEECQIQPIKQGNKQFRSHEKQRRTFNKSTKYDSNNQSPRITDDSVQILEGIHHKELARNPQQNWNQNLDQHEVMMIDLVQESNQQQQLDGQIITVDSQTQSLNMGIQVLQQNQLVFDQSSSQVDIDNVFNLHSINLIGQKGRFQDDESREVQDPRKFTPQRDNQRSFEECKSIENRDLISSQDGDQLMSSDSDDEFENEDQFNDVHKKNSKYNSEIKKNISQSFLQQLHQQRFRNNNSHIQINNLKLPDMTPINEQADIWRLRKNDSFLNDNLIAFFLELFYKHLLDQQDQSGDNDNLNSIFQPDEIKLCDTFFLSTFLNIFTPSTNTSQVKPDNKQIPRSQPLDRNPENLIQTLQMNTQLTEQELEARSYKEAENKFERFAKRRISNIEKVKHMIVPVHRQEDQHWAVAFLCNLDKKYDEANLAIENPCIIYCDSMLDISKEIQQSLNFLLLSIYKKKHDKLPLKLVDQVSMATQNSPFTFQEQLTQQNQSCLQSPNLLSSPHSLERFQFSYFSSRVNLPMQENGFDCGLYLIKNTEMFLRKPEAFLDVNLILENQEFNSESQINQDEEAKFDEDQEDKQTITPSAILYVEHQDLETKFIKLNKYFKEAYTIHILQNQQKSNDSSMKSSKQVSPNNSNRTDKSKESKDDEKAQLQANFKLNQKKFKNFFSSLSSDKQTMIADLFHSKNQSMKNILHFMGFLKIEIDKIFSLNPKLLRLCQKHQQLQNQDLRTNWDMSFFLPANLQDSSEKGKPKLQNYIYNNTQISKMRQHLLEMIDDLKQIQSADGLTIDDKIQEIIQSYLKNQELYQ
eukprot:403348100